MYNIETFNISVGLFIIFGFFILVAIFAVLCHIYKELELQNKLSSKKMAVLIAHSTLSAKERGMSEGAFIALVEELSTDD